MRRAYFVGVSDDDTSFEYIGDILPDLLYQDIFRVLVALNSTLIDREIYIGETEDTLLTAACKWYIYEVDHTISSNSEDYPKFKLLDAPEEQ